MTFHCPECDFVATKKSELLKHQRAEYHLRSFRCDICDALFTRKSNLDRHLEKHKQCSVHCQHCGRAFSRPDALQRHMHARHQVGEGNKRQAGDKNDTGPTKRLRKEDDLRQFYSIRKMQQQNNIVIITNVVVFEL